MRREELERGKLLLILVHALNKYLKKQRVCICNYECMTALMLANVFLLFICKE